MNIDLDKMNEDLEQLRVELMLSCLSVSRDDSHCSVYLHYENDLVVSGTGHTLKSALADAVDAYARRITNKLTNGDQSNG